MDKTIKVRQHALPDLQTATETHDNQASGKPMPKFASFRPKEVVPPRAEYASGPGHIPSKDESHAKIKHRNRRRSKDGERVRHGPQNRHATRQLTPLKPAGSRSVNAEQQTDDFVVDGAGDSKNLTFGTLDRYATPAYSRIGAGNVIGSKCDLKIDKLISNERELVLSAHERIGRDAKLSLLTIGRGDSRELKVKKEATSDDALGQAVDFIPLRSALATKRKRGDDGKCLGPSSSDDETTHHRSILGKASLMKEVNDPDLEYITDISSSSGHQPGIFDDQLQRKRVELVRRVDSEPDNSEAWLQLIHYQDKLLGPRSTSAERLSSFDIKLSMYEKALDVVKGAEGRQNLLMEMMEEASKIWDSRKMSNQWSKVLKDNPKFFGLWTTYLDFKQTAFPSFRYEEVQNVFLDCISILRDFSSQCVINNSEQSTVYESRVFVLLRMTLYMREAGFFEHAVAAWQALLEFEFFAPSDHLQGSAKQGKLSDFERFWESEVPRIGEDGLSGWTSFCKREGRPPEPESMVVEPINHGDDFLSAWIAMERTNTVLSQRPARTTDDIMDNDPYRVMLFSDVQPFLTNAPSLDGRHVLLDAFLVFCQLPSRRADSLGRIWCKDGFLRNEALYSDHKDLLLSRKISAIREQRTRGMSLQLDSPERSLFDFPNQDFQMDSEILFAEKRSWFSAFNNWQRNNNTRQSPIQPTWVVNSLKGLLASEVGDDQLAEYVLALELCLSPESVKKTAKSLLKKRTSSLLLYNAYSLIEYRLGNAGKGESALIAAINMSKDLKGVAGWDCILLWRTWIWELLGEGRGSEAFSRLQTYGDAVIEPIPQQSSGEMPPNPAKMLRTENALQAFREQMLSLQSPKHAVFAMECLILFAYLKNTSSLGPATLVFTDNLHLLSVKSINTASSEESLHQSFARLLYYHANHTYLFCPSDIRALLAKSVAHFPQNTIFLSLYAWNETRFRIDDRVRSIVRDIVLGANGTNMKGEESVVSHFFAIHTELSRGVALGSNDHAVRATFERAVESKSGAHCAGIWKMYFLFEHSRGDLKKAAAVVYRGIRASPWSKELYLLPFEYLREGPGAMREVDLRGLYDLMVEKELRVHVDLEELIERRAR